MSKYLIKTVETYRVANDKEAKELIEESKADKTYNLLKYSSENKEHKTKGEVDDIWVRVSLTKVFNKETEPDSEIDVKYDSYIQGV